MAANFTLGEIVLATDGVLTKTGNSDMSTQLAGISTDTRTLGASEAFFALIGENYDAHDHLEEAAKKGAALLVVSDPAKAPSHYPGAVLTVQDTLRAYQDLAAYYRRRLNPLVIAITGSVGKTTLKDMIACILKGQARVCGTAGNLNNQVGLPRTILAADENAEVLVLEMGMAYAGDIKRLADIARPEVCVITNIGISHRENFDSDDGILRAKFEITSYLGNGGALVIDAAGDAGLAKLAAEGSRENGYKLVCVAARDAGAAASADYIVSAPRICESDVLISEFDITEQKTGETVHFAIPLPGTYAGVSAALAAAASACAGVSLADSAERLKALERTPHRLEPLRKGGILVIDDTYNASPDSAKSGLAWLAEVPAKRRIAVLADMNELGSASEAMHREVGMAAAGAGVDILYTFGDKAMRIAAGAQPCAVHSFGPDEKEALIACLRKDLKEGDVIYIKGSRSMKMEEIARALTGET